MDSGADECVFPATTADFRCPRSSDLVAANGSSIKTFGKRLIEVSFAPGRRFSHHFWIATVKRPILGADFFSEHGLLIDIPRRRLIDRTGFTYTASLSSAPSISGLRLPAAGPYESLLENFPSLLVQNFAGQMKHNVRHYVPTRGPPIHSRPRRLDGEKLQVAKQEFRKMEEMGVIRRSDSPWSSPLHVVPKADGSWRPCGDYRRLNVITEEDRYPLPHIHDFNARLHGATVFSVVDLVRGLHQIPMAEEHVPKTAIVTPFGLFEFLRMPFGLKNACLLYTSPSPRDS